MVLNTIGFSSRAGLEDFLKKKKLSIIEGGECILYHDDKTAYKILKPGLDNLQDREFKLMEIMKRTENKLDGCMPRIFTLVLIAGEFAGFEMEYISNTVNIEEYCKEHYSNQNIKQDLKLCIQIAKLVEKIHELGIVIGDLHFRQIMVNEERLKQGLNAVYIADMDSWGIPELGEKYLPCDSGIDQFIDPKCKLWYGDNDYMNRGFIFKSDVYACAVIIFYILSNSLIPFDNGKYKLLLNELDDKTKMHERFRKRITLIDNPNCKTSVITGEWKKWMCADLKYAFIRIFEDDYRFSLIPYLEEQINLIGTNYSCFVDDVIDYVFYNNFCLTDEKFVNDSIFCDEEGKNFVQAFDDNNQPYYELAKSDSKTQNVFYVCRNANGEYITCIYDQNTDTVNKVSYDKFDDKYIYENLNIADAIFYNNCLYISDHNRIIKVKYEIQKKFAIADVDEEKNYIVREDSTIGFNYLNGKEKIIIVTNDKSYVMDENHMLPTIEEYDAMHKFDSEKIDMKQLKDLNENIDLLSKLLEKVDLKIFNHIDKKELNQLLQTINNLNEDIKTA